MSDTGGASPLGSNLSLHLPEEDYESASASNNDDNNSSSDFVKEVIKTTSFIISEIGLGKSLKRESKEAIIEASKALQDLANRHRGSPFPTPGPLTPTITNDTTVAIGVIKSAIKEEIEKQFSKQILQSTKSLPSMSKSYAASLKQKDTRNDTPKPPAEIPSTRPAIIVSAKSQVKGSSETVQHWTQSVSFRDTNFAPARIQQLSNNKVRVEFESHRHLEVALHKASHPNSTIIAEEAKKLQPMIILKGISTQTPVEELVDTIYEQNDCIKAACEKMNIILKFKRDNRNSSLYNAVLMVTPACFRAMINSGRINVDHSRVHAEMYTPLLHCYKCMQFGHTRKHCKQNSVCSHCSQTGHEFRECPLKNNKQKACCINCFNTKRTNTNHSATSQSCPIVIHMINKTRERTDYGK